MYLLILCPSFTMIFTIGVKKYRFSHLKLALISLAYFERRGKGRVEWRGVIIGRPSGLDQE
jgi:hypothetical protein